MFPLKLRKVAGYSFGQKTFYGAKHLGADYRAATGTQLYAPFDGEVIKQLIGQEGGLTVWFKPDNANVIMRFMHLSKFGKKGRVKMGDGIGLTGNTGKLTKAAHLHLDISKKWVNLYNFSNFLDPEKYAW